MAFIILPLFALANTSIAIGAGWQDGLGQASSLGIIAGLAIGKPLGIWLFSLLGTSLGICALPSDLKFKNILAVGFLGGIGFTMSIFITILAFDSEELINSSKIAIIVASLIAGVIGFVFLKATLKEKIEEE